MKKILLSALLSAFTAAAFAALPGEKPGESKHKLQWIDCSPMPLGKIDPDKHKDIPALRAVVFMYTRAQESGQTVAMLDNLHRQYLGKLLIAAITPDSVKDARAIKKRYPESRFRLAVDLTRKLTPEFMNNSIMIFPMAFLLDSEGTVLWRGEAADLPEVTAMQLAGKLDIETVKKCEPLIYKMFQAMRDNNIFSARSIAMDILKIDSANASALRMLNFAAEAMGNIRIIWNALSQAISKNPALARLYFSALDLTRRHTELRPELPELIRSFGKNDFPVPVRCAFADALLNSFSFESAAVLGARDILAGTPMALNAPAEQMGHLLAVRARLRYALGDLDSAEADMAEAVEFFKKSSDRTMLARAEKQLEFFRTLLKNRQGSAQ